MSLNINHEGVETIMQSQFNMGTTDKTGFNKPEKIYLNLYSSK